MKNISLTAVFFFHVSQKLAPFVRVLEVEEPAAHASWTPISTLELGDSWRDADHVTRCFDIHALISWYRGEFPLTDCITFF